MVRVLIVGDSISMGYGAALGRALSDVAQVEQNPGNGGDSGNVAAKIRDWLRDAQPDVLVLNCGLHDIKRNRETGAYQVPLGDYRRNLQFIGETVAAAGCALVWVTTTPVIEARHRVSRDFDRFNADIEAYNAAAESALREHADAMIPLHGVAQAMGLEEHLTADGVHFTEEGSEKLGGALAQALRPVVTGLC